jgi:hypothetical protein
MAARDGAGRASWGGSGRRLRMRRAGIPGCPGLRHRYPGAVRLTVFWEKMRGQFGEAYAASVAKDFVLTGLGGATVNQALAAGKEPKTVWLAVCEAFEIPEEAR